MSSPRRTRVLAGIAALALTLGLAACSSEVAVNPSPSNGISVTIGSQGTVENEIIAQLYGQALAFHGYDVAYNQGIGTRKQYIAGMVNGLIDFMPEYSGSLMAGLDSSSRLTDTSDMVSVMPRLLKERELRVLEPSPAHNGYVLVVTKEFAAMHNLVNIGDLQSVAANISIGATPEFEDLRYGRAGLNSGYNVTGWTFVPVDDETGTQLIEDLTAGTIQVAAVHASAPSISGSDLVVLGDPAQLVSDQNVLPFIRDAVYTKKFAAIVNSVSAELTTADLQAMNAIGATTTPETIAREWLEKHGFLGAPADS